jgi:hypothetical protein
MASAAEPSRIARTGTLLGALARAPVATVTAGLGAVDGVASIVGTGTVASVGDGGPTTIGAGTSAARAVASAGSSGGGITASSGNDASGGLALADDEGRLRAVPLFVAAGRGAACAFDGLGVGDALVAAAVTTAAEVGAENTTRAFATSGTIAMASVPSWASGPTAKEKVRPSGDTVAGMAVVQS